MRPTNGRAHLSIGEVLSLLQDEFPDVTISKIRFLESQGLLDPERTPSGYRKFYNTDIERLRWILRQQKEHYLPLRVIKDRLDQAGGAIPEDDLEETAGQQHLPTGERNEGPVRAGGLHGPQGSSRTSARNGVNVAVDSRPDAQHDAGPRGAPAPAPPGPSGPPGPPDRWTDSSWPDEPPLDVDPDDLGRPQVLPAPPPRPEPPLSSARKAANDRAVGPPIRERAVEAELRQGEQGRSNARGNESRPSRSRPTTTGAGGPHSRSAQQHPGRPEERTGPGPAAAGMPPLSASSAASAGPTASAGPAGSMSDVSLTVEELAEASGLSARDIRDLEKFGLIEQTDSGERFYDGDALIVAHTAAGFLQHGIEARHLRTYKVAMEREAGLFEQVILPVLKQRNPEARQRAARTVTELIRLGEVMRSVLLRRELRDHLGGG